MKAEKHITKKELIAFSQILESYFHNHHYFKNSRLFSRSKMANQKFNAGILQSLHIWIGLFDSYIFSIASLVIFNWLKIFYIPKYFIQVYRYHKTAQDKIYTCQNHRGQIHDRQPKPPDSDQNRRPENISAQADLPVLTKGRSA